MSAVGSFGSAPPLCRPARGPAGKQVGLESNPPRPTDSLTSSSSLPPLQFPGVPLSGKYCLPSAKGKPWKMLLYASSGQRNYVSKQMCNQRASAVACPRPLAPRRAVFAPLGSWLFRYRPKTGPEASLWDPAGHVDRGEVEWVGRHPLVFS